ncbi:MAG: hypothetical protein LUD72_06655 [Bacteroidales bacterium]|nr:hypothetical protein [Bacteroidales bacterium]
MRKKMVEIDSEKAKEYVKISGKNMTDISLELGYSHDVIPQAIRFGRIAEDTIGQFCDLIGINEKAILIPEEEPAVDEIKPIEYVTDLNDLTKELEETMAYIKEDLCNLNDLLTAKEDA